jgi:hypothetical protein
MSYISTDTGIKDPRFGNAWRADGGEICATVRLATSGTYIAFYSAADARAVAAACIEAAEAMDRLADGTEAGQ